MGNRSHIFKRIDGMIRKNAVTLPRGVFLHLAYKAFLLRYFGGKRYDAYKLIEKSFLM